MNRKPNQGDSPKHGSNPKTDKGAENPPISLPLLRRGVANVRKLLKGEKIQG